MNRFAHEIAEELGLSPQQVDRTLTMHEEGATVPFLARYRKEATGGLDEVQLQAILEGATRLRELFERKEAVLRSIEEQGKLTEDLRASIERVRSRAELEDLYLPYRPRRRTRATMAKERGLEPLAELLLQGADPFEAARSFIGGEVADAQAALAGARDILAERVAEDPAFRRRARDASVSRGRLRSEATKKAAKDRTRFESWYGHEEGLAQAPSHRVLALFRGEAEGALDVSLQLPDEEIESAIVRRFVRGGRASSQLEEAARDGYRRLLRPSIQSELRAEIKARADGEAIEIFGRNLRHLLLAPPAGTRPLLALDPGLRTGIKAVALDGTGKLLAAATLYSERSAGERAQAARQLKSLIDGHAPQLIAVGNGTGSREAEAFVREVLAASGLQLPVVSVSEQGASVYSASEVAREEFPDLDVSLRGAVSIGRRLQDPLAELVKLDPRSIGVGQYQHDVDQKLLAKKLGDVVDSAVNAVGVDVNTASPQLLEHVSGVGRKLAKAIVSHREENGRFESRAALRKVKGLGPRAFEQAAGFLRVRGGKEPLDDSAVHPERYALVAKMAKDLGVEKRKLVGNAELVARIEWRRYLDDELGEPTLRDILAELEKPGRDPRGDFEAPSFRPELQKLEDVKEGMVLQGVVTNVTAFGAFVDVGVHHDGLVHVSQLGARYVKDPNEVVKVGDRLQVKVIGVDLERKRLSLSVKALQAEGATSQPRRRQREKQPFHNPFGKLRGGR